jgi:hypothetical protein
VGWGTIASLLGLPIPSFAQTYCSASLADASPIREAHYFKAFPGFGSRTILDAAHFAIPHADMVPRPLRQKIFWFDWWIQNGDRSEGNPNLLWVAHRRELYVIDHNLAFGDDAGDIVGFLDSHIFAPEVLHFPGDFRASFEPQFSYIMDKLDGVWEQMPDEWSDDWISTRENVDRILQRYHNDDFWKLK